MNKLRAVLSYMGKFKESAISTLPIAFVLVAVFLVERFALAPGGGGGCQSSSHLLPPFSSLYIKQAGGCFVTCLPKLYHGRIEMGR